MIYKPVFFICAGRIWSGWRQANRLWTTRENLLRLLPVDTDLGILEIKGCMPVPDALRVREGPTLGDKVVFTQNADLEPYTTVMAGEEGVVACANGGHQGEVALRLSEMHPGLAAIDNMVWLTPHQTDDLLVTFKLMRRVVPVMELACN